MKITMKKMMTLSAVLASMTLATTTMGFAKDSCDVKAKGSYSFISNSQPTFLEFSKELKGCKNVDIDWKVLVDNKASTYEAFLAPKSPLSGAVVSNAQFGQLQAEGLVKPITKLVEKNRSKYPFLTDDMLIKVNGEIYAIAFVTNLQHLIYRKDLFAKYNLPEPKTYTDLLKSLKVLKEKGDVDYPFGAAYKSGWNLGTEFVNLFLSTGNTFFKPGTSTANINNKDGRRALKMMKKLYKYSSPNSLALASGDVTGLFQSGEVGVMQMWASRAAVAEDVKLSKVIGKVALSSALKLSAKDPYTASSMFWDGFVIPKNTQADPDKTFEIFMELLDKETITRLNDKSVWISPYATIQKYSKGIVDTRKNKVRVFPSTPQFNLLHSQIGKNLGDYLSGSKSAGEVLKKIERDYRKVAKEKGYM